MIEWGISYNDFMDTPFEVIQRMKDYKRAEGEAIKSKNKKSQSARK